MIEAACWLVCWDDASAVGITTGHKLLGERRGHRTSASVIDIATTVHYFSDTSSVYPSAVLSRSATPSVLHQRHRRRVLRSSCTPHGRSIASSRGREPQPGRCPSVWPGDLRNDGISV